MKEAFYTVGALTTFGASWNVEYNRDGSVKKVTSDFATEKGLKAAKMMLKIMSSDAVVYTQDAPGVNNVAFCVMVLGHYLMIAKEINQLILIQKLKLQLCLMLQ